jgi:glyoxylase-like metal-dependent hydrolase (beta-lactamase superfamily II)
MEKDYTELATSNFPYMPITSVSSGKGESLAVDLFYETIQIVNICLFGNPDVSNEWVLIDTGMPKSAGKIKELAEERFGKNHIPKAIILTHGHFDHVGAVTELVNEWNVPVYAHSLELPFLTSESNYPEPDGSVEGGIIAKMSPLFPNEAINLKNYVHALPENGEIPHMPGWKWIHTPGHTPGHVSFFREEDKLLIAGDAFVTVRQDELYNVLIQKQELNGPPRYFTTNWMDAWNSIKKLESLKPEIAITGHGSPMFGKELETNLHNLVVNFESIAKPDYGRYV